MEAGTVARRSRDNDSYSRRNDDRIIVIGGGDGGRSYDRGERHDRSSSGGSFLGPILGIALLAGAAGLGYYLYTQNSCQAGSNNQCGADGNMQECLPWPNIEGINLFNVWQDVSPAQACTPTPGQDCSSPTGKNGATQCVGTQLELCSNGVWHTTGSTCGGSHTKGIACSVPGSGYCGSSDGKYYVCESDGYAYSDGTNCPAANASPCTKLACSNQFVQCGGGVISGDSTNDYYTDYVCNPIQDKCNFLLVTHNSPACMATKPAAMGVIVNGVQYAQGQPVAVLSSAVNGCNATCLPIVGCIGAGNSSATPAKISILVADSTGAGIGGATVTITSDQPHIGGFVNPDDTSDLSMNCTSDTATTDATGVVKFEWVHTKMADTGHTTSQVNMTVAMTHGGSTYTTSFPIQMDNNETNIIAPGGSNLTCEGLHYGSQCQ